MPAAEKHKPFKDRFSLGEYAALAIAANFALTNCGTADKKGKPSGEPTAELFSSESFWQRHLPLLKEADHRNGRAWAPEESIIANDRKARNRELQKVYRAKLREHLESVRNYFSHYTHTPVKLQEATADPVLMNFLELLAREAVTLWKKRHAAWRDKKDSGNGNNKYPELSDKMDSIAGLPLTEKTNGPESPSRLSRHAILLYLSVFLSRGDMFRLLDKTLRETSPEDIEAAREFYSAASFRDANVIGRSNEDAGVIAALTTLNHFATIYGHTKDRDGTPLMPVPKDPEDIIERHSDTFFIKMLVTFIEANQWLPSFEFARTFNGSPVFDAEKETLPLYIRHNNVTARFKNESGENGKYETATFSLHLLKLVAIFALKDPKQIKGSDCWLKNKLRQFKKKAAENAPLNADPVFDRMTPAFMRGEPGRPLPEGTPLDEVVRRRLDFLQNKWFGTPASDLPPHRQATAILHAINFVLPPEEKLNGPTYYQALLALTNYNQEELAAALPDLPKKRASLKDQQLRAFIKGAGSLEKLFVRTKSAFKKHADDLLTDFSALSPKDQQARAAAVGVQAERKRIDPDAPEKQRARKQARGRFIKRLASIPPELYFRNFFHGILNGNSAKLKADRLPYAKALRKVEGLKTVQALLPFAAYQGELSSDQSRRCREILNRDLLLLLLMHKQLSAPVKANGWDVRYDQKSWSATFVVRLEKTGKSVSLDADHGLKLYVRTDPARLEKVLANYWPSAPDEVPFLNPPGTGPRQSGPPRSWREAEGDMEQERYLMQRALLILEKQTDERQKLDRDGEGGRYTEFHTVADTVKEKAGLDEDQNNKIKMFRNWAFHRSPEEPFHNAPNPLGQLFKKERAALAEKRQEKKIRAQKRAGKR